jgi:hypothetical protein
MTTILSAALVRDLVERMLSRLDAGWTSVIRGSTPFCQMESAARGDTGHHSIPQGGEHRPVTRSTSGDCWLMSLDDR